MRLSFAHMLHFVTNATQQLNRKMTCYHTLILLNPYSVTPKRSRGTGYERAEVDR